MIKRKAVLQFGAVATASLIASGSKAIAHNLPPKSFGNAAYEAALMRTVPRLSSSQPILKQVPRWAIRSIISYRCR